MLRFIFLVSFLSVSLFASANESIKSYFTEVLSQNRAVKLVSMDILSNQKVEGLGAYKIFFVKLKLQDLKSSKEFDVIEKVFSDGKFLVNSFIDLETKQDIKRYTFPNIPKSVYKKSHLIAGKKSAKHKILVFSDPMCPFCKKTLPDLINFVSLNPDVASLYYYHFPLAMHPRAEFISKMMLASKDKDAIKKAYATDFGSTPNNPKDLVAKFNESLTLKLVISDVNTSSVQNTMDQDIKIATKLAINGTPAIFIDGKFDRDYQKLLPKKK